MLVADLHFARLRNGQHNDTQQANCEFTTLDNQQTKIGSPLWRLPAQRFLRKLRPAGPRLQTQFVQFSSPDHHPAIIETSKSVDIRCNFICYIPVHHQHPCQFPVQLWPSLPNPQQLAPPQHREGVAHAHEPVQRLIKDIYSDRAALFTGTLCARTRIELDFANDVGSFDLLVFIESIKDEMKEFSTTKLIEIRDAAVAAWIAGKIRVSDRFLQRLELKDLWALDLNHGSIRIHRSAFIPVQELGLWSDQKYKFIRGGRIKHGQ